MAGGFEVKVDEEAETKGRVTGGGARSNGHNERFSGGFLR